MKPFSDAMEEFLIAGRQKGWRKGTVGSYRWHLTRFDKWLVQHGSNDLEALTIDVVRKWGAELHDGWQIATTRGAIGAARSFFRWLLDEKVIEVDLASSLKMPRVPEHAQRTISSAEVGEIFKACAMPTHETAATEHELNLAVRNVAIVAVLYDSLVRAAELCALKVNDIDFKRGTLRIRSGKGGMGRTAPIGPDAVLALKVWLPMRRPATGVDNVFVSIGGLTPGRPLTVAGLRLILRRLGERCDLDGVCPHAFRRGGAVAATLAGAPSRLVQLWGGWSNIRMVELYTRTLQNDPGALAEFRRFSPLSSVTKGMGWLILQAGQLNGSRRRLRAGKRARRRESGRLSAIRWARKFGGQARIA